MVCAAVGFLGMIGSARGGDSRFFTTSDHIRLHYLQRGEGRTLVFVPGWTMPAWIFEAQVAHFATTHRVVALDPRSQGDSQVSRARHAPERRADDIAELLAHLAGDRVVLIGWSLGVLESLAYIRRHGDERIRALVLIDNSVGEDPPPASRVDMIAALRKDRAGATRRFVRSMFKREQPESYLERLTHEAMKTPLTAAIELLSYPYPRESWRDALYSTGKPVLYAVTPRWQAQAVNVERRHDNARVAVFGEAGHALFVDEAERFNRLLEEFLGAVAP